MEWIIYLLIILIVLDKVVLSQKNKRKENRKLKLIKKDNKKLQALSNNQAKYAGQYTKVSLLTKREQKQYAHLKKIADEKGVLICPKIRLIDLVTPIHGVKNYQTLKNKVMSKHVDFVVCTQDMRVLGIIELDDSTHLRQDRIERDEFVDVVLISVGYRIKHVWEISSDILDSFIDEVPLENHEVKIISPTGWIWNEDTKLWDPPKNLK